MKNKNQVEGYEVSVQSEIIASEKAIEVFTPETNVLSSEHFKNIKMAQPLKSCFSDEFEYQKFVERHDNPLVWMIDRNAITEFCEPISIFDCNGLANYGYFSIDLLQKFQVSPEQILIGAKIKILNDNVVYNGIICAKQNPDGKNITGIFIPAVKSAYDENKKTKKDFCKKITAYFLSVGENDFLYPQIIGKKTVI